MSRNQDEMTKNTGILAEREGRGIIQIQDQVRIIRKADVHIPKKQIAGLQIQDRRNIMHQNQGAAKVMIEDHLAHLKGGIPKVIET